MDRTSKYDGDAIGSDTTLSEPGATTGDTTLTEPRGTTTVAAAFAQRERAHEAVHRLHDEGFRDTWIGITRADEGLDYSPSPTASPQTRVESENWFMRFFGEGDVTLHDALARRGVNEADARSVATLPAHSAILTVDGANHPELAAQIIAECGGQLITSGFGATGYGTAGKYGSSADYSETSASRTGALYDQEMPAVAGSRPLGATEADTQVEEARTADAAAYDATVYDDYGRYRAGTPVDESTRLQLREERLRVDKSRVSAGEATIGTEIVTERQDFDVPVIREELFIERRPAGSSASAETTPIGSDRDVIRVPLSQEEVHVTKVPVVTEEVVVGKRQVESNQRVSETTRKEQLNVNDADATVGAGNMRDPRL